MDTLNSLDESYHFCWDPTGVAQHNLYSGAVCTMGYVDYYTANVNYGT